MDVVVLAGGFARRMWPLTKNQPKHLLPVSGKPMLDYVIDNFEEVEGLNQIFISTNTKFKSQFKQYLKKRRRNGRISLFIEDTYSENEKFGSVAALGYLIKEKKIKNELLVVGGDNIFSFKIIDFLKYFRQVETNVVALYDINSKDSARLYGVVCLDTNNRIIDFQEKPINPK